MHDDFLCYLHPIWPTSKVMWHDYFTTANELCVVVTPSGDRSPPDGADDRLFDRRRDLRTLYLIDHVKGIWRSLAPVVNWHTVKTWLDALPIGYSQNSQALSKLGKPKSQSLMLMDIGKSCIVHVHALENICYAALSYVWGAARTSEKWCQDIQQLHDANVRRSIRFLTPLLACLRESRIALHICPTARHTLSLGRFVVHSTKPRPGKAERHS